MKVFISWSGERSKAIAEALYSWLPTIIQNLTPWMSEHDIDKGTKGLSLIAKQLEETQFGVICLTPENLNAPWLLFEAGALSKSQDDSRVWTFLYQMEYTDVRGPLAQFQHTKTEKSDIRGLLHAINVAQSKPLISENQLETAFNRGWKELEKHFSEIPYFEENQPERTEKDMIKELLELTRTQASERRQKSYEADRYISSFLPLLINVFANDPKYKDSDLGGTLGELQFNALNRIMTSKIFSNENNHITLKEVSDPACGSGEFQSNISDEMIEDKEGSQ